MKRQIAIACLTAAGAAASAAPPRIVELPSYDAPSRPWTDIAETSRELACRDRIERIRAEAGKPVIERRAVDPAKPLMFHAVDQKIDGCAVLVPVSDPTDVRTSPAPGKPERIPAR